MGGRRRDQGEILADLRTGQTLSVAAASSRSSSPGSASPADVIAEPLSRLPKKTSAYARRLQNVCRLRGSPQGRIELARRTYVLRDLITDWLPACAGGLAAGKPGGPLFQPGGPTSAGRRAKPGPAPRISGGGVVTDRPAPSAGRGRRRRRRVRRRKPHLSQRIRRPVLPARAGAPGRAGDPR